MRLNPSQRSFVGVNALNCPKDKYSTIYKNIPFTFMLHQTYHCQFCCLVKPGLTIISSADGLWQVFYLCISRYMQTRVQWTLLNRITSGQSSFVSIKQVVNLGGTFNTADGSIPANYLIILNILLSDSVICDFVKQSLLCMYVYNFT